MNEGKNVESITVIIVLMLLFAGQSSASFIKCFTGCGISCIFRNHKLICALKCLAECLIGVGSTSSGLEYCKLGCAVHRCARYANDFNNEDVDRVDGCVNECEIGECGFLAAAQAGMDSVNNSATPSQNSALPTEAQSP